MEITENPSEIQLTEALDIVNQNALHIYQVLYDKRLANPGDGGPILIERDNHSFSISPRITLRSKKNPKIGVSLYFPSDEELIEKAELVLKAVDLPIQMYACCGLAERSFCVCVASFTCPLHGHMCIGSHD